MVDFSSNGHQNGRLGAFHVKILRVQAFMDRIKFRRKARQHGKPVEAGMFGGDNARRAIMSIPAAIHGQNFNMSKFEAATGARPIARLPPLTW